MPLYNLRADFPIVQLVAHQFLALVVMVRVHLGKPKYVPIAQQDRALDF